MSKGADVPYRLRPNKAVDRELFLALLSRLAQKLPVHEYKYIGMGGAFLEDFRLIHGRLGLKDMVSVEEMLDTHLRQRFNKPVPSINCIHSTLEEYLNSHEFEAPVILWLDFTKPGLWPQQFQTLTEQLLALPLHSVVRITLNANPEFFPPLPGMKPNEVPGHRVSLLQKLFPGQVPPGLTSDDMSKRAFGRTLLRVLSIAVDGALLGAPGRAARWALSTAYADGQPMATATFVITAARDESLDHLLASWEHQSSSLQPLVIDVPALSTLERLTLEACDDPETVLNFKLPRSSMREDPIASFRRFYRIFPHFSRVEL